MRVFITRLKSNIENAMSMGISDYLKNFLLPLVAIKTRIYPNLTFFKFFHCMSSFSSISLFKAPILSYLFRKVLRIHIKVFLMKLR